MDNNFSIYARGVVAINKYGVVTVDGVDIAKLMTQNANFGSNEYGAEFAGSVLLRIADFSQPAKIVRLENEKA